MRVVRMGVEIILEDKSRWSIEANEANTAHSWLKTTLQNKTSFFASSDNHFQPCKYGFQVYDKLSEPA
jgi:hypothetical protein